MSNFCPFLLGTPTLTRDSLQTGAPNKHVWKLDFSTGLTKFVYFSIRLCIPWHSQAAVSMFHIGVSWSHQLQLGSFNIIDSSTRFILLSATVYINGLALYRKNQSWAHKQHEQVRNLPRRPNRKSQHTNRHFCGTTDVKLPSYFRFFRPWRM